MYLSRLTLDGRQRQVRGWLADCHALHRVIMSGFGEVPAGPARSALGVLYRVDPMRESPGVPVLVQSAAEPQWSLPHHVMLSVDPPRSVGRLFEEVSEGREYRFRLRANPTRRVHPRAALGPNPDGGRNYPEPPDAVGKRVELRNEEDRIRWLQRRGEASGFALVTTRLMPADRPVVATRADPSATLSGTNPRQHRLTIATALFEGVLRVTARDAFVNALTTGIGPGKAYGCGLLSIAPWRPHDPERSP